MAASDPQMPWITRGAKCCIKDQDYLDPYVWYNMLDSTNPAKTRSRGIKPNVRAKSASPTTSRLKYTEKHEMYVDGWAGSASSSSLRNPSPSPITSPAASLRSSRCNSTHKLPASSSPTSLYLGSRGLRCKSAPPARPFQVQPPQQPKTDKPRQRSAVRTTHNAPKRAWQMRTSSARTHHSLLSPEEVQRRHKLRCKSAPLPYDFSSIECVAKVPEEASDSARLQAMTRPLICMPDIVKNVLSHNGIKHCCSAYTTHPKTSPDMRQQFWPVSRPSTFHRGNVPKYLHFVHPISPGSRTTTAQSVTQQGLSKAGDDVLYGMEETHASLYGSDEEPAVLYEEQFLVPMTPSEPSVSEHWEASVVEDIDESQGHGAKVSSDLMQRYLEDVSNHAAETTLLEHPEPLQPLEEDTHLDHGRLYQDLAVDVAKKNGQMPEHKEPAEVECDGGDLTRNDARHITEQEGGNKEVREETTAEDDSKEDGCNSEEPLQNVAPSLETPVEQLPVETVGETPAETLAGTLVETVTETTKQAVSEDSMKVSNINSDPSQLKPQTNEVTFADSIVLTSYISPKAKAETKEVVKPILKASTQTPVVSDSMAKHVDPLINLELPKKKVKPLLDRREADLRPQTKENQPWAVKIKQKDEESADNDKKKNEEEKKEIEKKVEKRNISKMTEVFAKPNYVPAQGAYKMYQAQDLLQYYQEQSRERRQATRKSIPAVMPYCPWTPESAAVVNTVMEEEKRKKEGLKPWLQGRLALSKQTSRFELPMDIKVLEAMNPLEYLMKYCIISTRRKALYKHVFQKVDRDRDNKITFKEFDKALKEIHVDSINSQQVLKIAQMVEFTEKSIFSVDQFAAVAAFSERLLFSDFATPETSTKSHDSKEIIEEADFCGLKSKLNGFNINPPVRKILEIL